MTQSLEFRHRAACELVQGTVLDVGCGDGILLEQLEALGIEVQGTDISTTALDICRTKGFVVTRMEGERLPFADNSFDTVVALDVLEHTYDPSALLHEMKRVSKKNIVVGVPNFSSLPARLQVLRGGVPENNQPHKGHVYWFNKTVLTRLAVNGELTIDEWKMNTFRPMSLLPDAVIALAPNLLALSFVVRLSQKEQPSVCE